MKNNTQLIATTSCFLAFTTWGMGQTSASPATTREGSARSTQRQQPLSVPHDAVRDENGLYHWTDEQGQRWLYTETPFGVSRKPDIAAPTTPPKGIPAASRPNPDGSWAYTAPDGTKWNYAQTPFGISKLAVQPSAEASTASAGNDIRATDRGETVHFERQMPFGLKTWDKRKSEMNAEEKQAVEASKARGGQTDGPR